MTATSTKPKPLPRITAPTANTLIPGEWAGIIVPMAPPVEVTSNYHGKHRYRLSATDAYRECARLATVSVVNATILRSWEQPFPEGARLAIPALLASRHVLGHWPYDRGLVSGDFAASRSGLRLGAALAA
jgi:hypothetical protein